MDIQNNNVSIQINAKDLSGKQLRIADCDVFIVHVFTDDPKFYLVFSKRDMLMTEFVDELVIPKHQMEQLQSGVVQYTYHYLPVAHDCKYEEDRVESEGAYHPHRPHGHGHEDLIHSKPVVTPIYWRNLKHPHPVHPVNSVTLFDVERLHKLIENERVAREKDFEALQGRFTDEFDDRLDAEIERSTAADEKVNAEIQEIKSSLENLGKDTEDKNDKLDEDIKSNAVDITTEVARATQKEIELEQLIQGEVSRAKSAEEVIDTKITMEKERAVANESNINDRLVSLTDRFDAHKELITETLKSEVERAKSVESSLNDRVSGVVRDVADEISRAAQKDIEHTNLVETESNRAKAVENKIATDLETETGRAKDAEKHIIDEVHALQDNVASLATATNVYNKAEVDKKISDVRNDVSTLGNWMSNHTDNTDELKTKVANLVEDVDKAKADILAEVAKCDAQNGKLASEIQTLADSTYTKAEVDTKVSVIDSSISEIKNWVENHKDNTEGLAEKVNKNVSDIQTLNVNLATEINDRQIADTSINAKVDIVDGKVDAEITRAKAAEKLIADELADYKTLADAKHADIASAVADVNADLTLEIARAKAAEKVNADAINIITADASTAGSIKKSLSDAKDYVDIELAKLSVAKDAEIADTLKNYATNADVDKKISDVIGTAPEALDTLGKISSALSADSDAITAINGVLAGKADSDSVYTKGEIDTKITGVNNVISTLETKVDNTDSTLSSRIDDVNSKIAGIELDMAADSSALANALADEINRAKSAEKASSDKLNDEVDKLNTKISDVNATLIADIASSTAKDTELEAKIDANSAAITSETARAKAVETELNDKINGITISETNASLSAEVDRATAAESALQSNIDVESARAKAAEKVVSDNLADEVTRAKSAEKALSDRIDSLDLTGAENAIATLDTKIDNVQTTLQTNVDAEVVRAKAAEKNNADAIAALQGDVASAGTGLANLSASVTQLAADSQAKDSEIESAVNTETTRAENAEKSLSEKIDVINGDASVVGSIAHAVHDAEHYTDDEVAKVVSALEIHKAEADAKYLTEHQSLAAYYDKAQINDIFDGYATKGMVNNVIVECSRLNNDIQMLSADKAEASAVYTKAEVDEAIANVDVTDRLENYVTNASVNDIVNQAVADSSLFVELQNGLADEISRAKAAEKEITDSIEIVSGIVESAIEDLNNLFDSSTGTGGNLVEALDDYYTKEETNELIVNTSNEILSGIYTKSQADGRFLQTVTKSEEEYEALVEAGQIEENILYIII